MEKTAYRFSSLLAWGPAIVLLMLAMFLGDNIFISILEVLLSILLLFTWISEIQLNENGVILKNAMRIPFRVSARELHSVKMYSSSSRFKYQRRILDIVILKKKIIPLFFMHIEYDSSQISEVVEKLSQFKASTL